MRQAKHSLPRHLHHAGSITIRSTTGWMLAWPAVLLWGCSNQAAESPVGAGTDPTVDVGVAPSTPIVGTRSATVIPEIGSPSTTPVDLTGATIEALIPTESGYKAYPGTGKTDGTFSIPNVPDGTPYLLHYFRAADQKELHQYVETSLRSIDLGSYSNRTDVELGAKGTQLSINGVGGIEPWADTHVLQFYSANNGTYSFGFPTDFGATTLTHTQRWVGQPLQKEARGDRLYLLQQTNMTSANGTVVSAVTRAAQVSPFTMPSGVDTTVTSASATFAPTPMQTVTLDWRRSALAALKDASISGAASEASYGLYVNALPSGEDFPYGFYTNGADLLSLVTNTTDDLNVGAVQFGNPFSTSFGLFGINEAWFSVPYQLPGASTSQLLYATAQYCAPLINFDRGPIEPFVGPPLAVQINGQSAFTMTDPVTVQPTLTWQRPNVGIANYYVVTVSHIYMPAGTTNTAEKRIAHIQTPKTQLTLPPNLLESGQRYAFRVSSEYQPKANPNRPFVGSFPSGSAQMVSAVVSP